MSLLVHRVVQRLAHRLSFSTACRVLRATYHTAETNSSAVWYVALNTRHAVLKDRRVRQALNYAVNKDAIIRDILKGTAIVATTPLSPVYGAYHEDKTQRIPTIPRRPGPSSRRPATPTAST